MRSSYLPLAAALAFAAGVCAQAQAQPSAQAEPVPPPPPIPRPADQSKGEVQAARQFGWLDLNHDGFLSREEVALFPRLRDAFDQADTDKDNRVSFEEIRALAIHQREEKAAAAAATPGIPATVVPGVVAEQPVPATVVPAQPAPAPAPVMAAPAIQPPIAMPVPTPAPAPATTEASKPWWSWRPW